MAERTLDGTWADYEPHPEVDSPKQFEAFHEQVSIERKLRRAGVKPGAFVVGAVVAVVLLGGTVHVGFGVDHPFVTPPTLAATGFNTAIFLAGGLYIDRQFPVVVRTMRPSFEVDDATYYGFFGRMLERLYHRSMFSPVAAGPHGRSLGILHWGGLASTYAALVGIVFVLGGVPGESGTGLVLFALFVASVVGYGAVFLLSILLLLSVFLEYMGGHVAHVPIRLNTVGDDAHFGLAPYGRFVFRTTVLALAITLVTGLLGGTTGNPLLLLAATVATVVLSSWFVVTQYGLHRAIVSSKHERIARLREEYTDDLRQVYEHTTDEPSLTALESTRVVITVRDDIESMPDWPTDVRTVVELLAGVGLANVPTFATLLL